MKEDTVKMCNYKDMRENLVIKEGLKWRHKKKKRKEDTYQSQGGGVFVLR